LIKTDQKLKPPKTYKALGGCVLGISGNLFELTGPKVEVYGICEYGSSFAAISRWRYKQKSGTSHELKMSEKIREIKNG